jgi:hypothetical protein
VPHDELQVRVTDLAFRFGYDRLCLGVSPKHVGPFAHSNYPHVLPDQMRYLSCLNESHRAGPGPLVRDDWAFWCQVLAELSSLFQVFLEVVQPSLETNVRYLCLPLLSGGLTTINYWQHFRRDSSCVLSTMMCPVMVLEQY